MLDFLYYILTLFLFCFVLFWFFFFFFFFFPFLVRTMISSTHLTMTSKPPSATYHLHHSKPHQLYLCSTKHHRPPKRQNLLSCVYFLHKFCYSWFTWVPLPTFFFFVIFGWWKTPTSSGLKTWYSCVKGLGSSLYKNYWRAWIDRLQISKN